jgi:hypothetical protein
MSDSRSRRVRGFIPASLFLAASGALVGACASAPQPPVEVAHRMSPSEEAAAIEAAKHHPIALTYERPGASEALPVAPPPIPPEPPPPVPAQAPAPRDQVIVVGEAAPPAPAAPTYTWPSTDESYSAVDSSWQSEPSAHVYVDTWVGAPAFGWGWRYGYARPWGYYPPPVYGPPVVVAPAPHYWYGNHSHNYPAYVAPRARYVTPVYRAPTSRAYRAPASPAYRAPASPAYRAPASPAYRAPASSAYRAPAAPRRQVYVAPPSHSQSAPARMGSHSAPSRGSVHVR